MCTMPSSSSRKSRSEGFDVRITYSCAAGSFRPSSKLQPIRLHRVCTTFNPPGARTMN